MSHNVQELYKSAQVAVPKCIKGRKHHTLKAHRMAIALRKKGHSKEESWAIVMSKMGDKAYK